MFGVWVGMLLGVCLFAAWGFAYVAWVCLVGVACLIVVLAEYFPFRVSFGRVC